MSKPHCMHGVDRTLWVLKRRKDGRKYYECSACGGFIGFVRVERTKPEAKEKEK